MARSYGFIGNGTKADRGRTHPVRKRNADEKRTLQGKVPRDTDIERARDSDEVRLTAYRGTTGRRRAGLTGAGLTDKDLNSRSWPGCEDDAKAAK
ncbi:MAG TPA: hypothetical protein VG013_07040, partial [Gemmataceae bacterium]|nr:hypothetical protein [Gemmataceae bacterium]